MDRRTYDICMAAGLAATSAGAWLLGGIAVALLTFGPLLIALTLLGAVIAGHR